VQQGQSGAKPDPRGGLTLKQRQVMRMLARGSSIADAARKAGVNEKRVEQWNDTPNFRDALSRERVEPTHSSVAEVLREPGEPKEEIPRSSSARRSKAIDLLASGMMSITEAAERSGYTRQHLSYMLHHDVEFHAEYERRLTDEHLRRANFFWTMYDRSGGSSSSRSMRAIRERRWRSYLQARVSGRHRHQAPVLGRSATARAATTSSLDAGTGSTGLGLGGPPLRGMWSRGQVSTRTYPTSQGEARQSRSTLSQGSRDQTYCVPA
jgi:hypothetical protein